MPILINFRICDNSEACGGIEVCPSGAFYWDEKSKTIAVDSSKCTGCGLCERECPVGAIRFAKNEDEYQKIKRKIDEDTREISDLFIDRYGAEPIDSAFLIKEDEFEIRVLRSAKPTAVELFHGDSVECLLHSIPVKELFKNSDIKYLKLQVKDGGLLEKYDVEELPALLFFQSGKLIGKIEGYYDARRKKELLGRVSATLSQ